MRAYPSFFLALAVSGLVASTTVWTAPPRFDGAGYAVLARSIAEGTCYRSIDHPDNPVHTHFPPGYPLALAIVGQVSGNRIWAFHLFSMVCTAGATLAAYHWFRRLVGKRAAWIFGLALATNWAWVRAGGSIQSEPLFELLAQLAILTACRARERNDVLGSCLLGVLLGFAFLTRYVAIALIAAILLELAIARRWRNLIVSSIVSVVVIVPWVIWLVRASTLEGSGTQAGLILARETGLLESGAAQALFYARRIPDQLFGPFVEVATVFQRSRAVSLAADTWALFASLIVLLGWFAFFRNKHRRLAGIIPLMTLAVLLAWPFTEAGRFLIPLIPCLILGITEGLTVIGTNAQRLSGWVSRWTRSRLRLAAGVCVLAGGLPYTAYIVARGRPQVQEASYRDFDDACAWLASSDSKLPGSPVLTRHPGEVFLRTGRKAIDISTSERPGSRNASPDDVDATIKRYGIGFLLLDDGRYANAPASPLSRFVATYPDRVRKTWEKESGTGRIAIYEVTATR